ncbi:site-specific DNA-methyltransferase [Microbacterium sp. C7(2022)]|uniref:site-specific DNA-methyltransferase n=1 Tax=Microbacterium sp. C7(2022) TaxID=2992759 RepID=UPI00237B086D|nr:DNA methyltransferase [Microbacterium sp. C7(2022)]MDE0547436.1 DNA methyltransferase [Microbacterium sp. C7(2022)]
MSHLNDLIRQLATKDEALARDIEREVTALQDRRAFGLNFERHQPEAVELPGRKVRRGDKVRVLPPRGQMPKKENERLFKVREIATTDDGRVAAIEALDDAEAIVEVAIEDLVVVAEFRDPIYPGLVSTGKVERGGDKPYHSVINAENYHALQALLFTHRGKVDCIYIDPPYNTGAKDWKYNNDYVEGDDLYRHSKWLAFMERRLLLAKELLNPDDSVLIVTIDEKEYLRLGMLLEQLFAEATIQMISSSISPSGMARGQEFRRSDEYIYFVTIGSAAPTPIRLGEEWLGRRSTSTGSLRWNGLMRSGTEARRQDRPGMFYPILLDAQDSKLLAIGAALSPDAPRDSYVAPAGQIAIWPIRTDGSEGRWQIGPESAAALVPKGYLKIGRFAGDRTAIAYLKSGEQSKVEKGVFGAAVIGKAGHIEVEGSAEGNLALPTTQWSLLSHSAAEFGSTLLRAFIPSRRFPFPKSLYAVEDALRFFILRKPSALVVDFFSGSGTTAHAVMRINKQAGGARRCIAVTNNEVSSDEQVNLRKRGLRPGDTEWEQIGICDFITKPRIRAAITGETADGAPIKGVYKFTDEFPMAEGFEENVEFFSLTYESPLRIEANREFSRIAPLLWLRAGSKGRRIDVLPAGWDVAETYGVISDLDNSEQFAQAIAAAPEASIAFIITDEDRLFEALVRELPEHVEPVRLYEAYLRTFEIEARRAAER